jgi:hypothetical protein
MAGVVVRFSWRVFVQKPRQCMLKTHGRCFKFQQVKVSAQKFQQEFF